ncbi:hypothetical protein AMYBAR_005265 [Amycolatopsis bartoniae]|uniref:DUF4304 domain-containing protein n=1 Tax=Amycolatopsis bartoniae TaxID=941986 RepID=A0A8H9MEZ6_9PSEU|nr:hypothetical protein [Amycolatopsis bartoniae]TVT11308.1 hypothetical protein FNH07_02625 [Amycolatopsis bartoniae]GHF66505.1 hypothetical protein GCM10017566_45380 [Amycolatopsis bartoniae]
MSDREQRLAHIVDAVRVALSGLAFDREGSVLSRVVGDGIVQVIEFEFGYGGPTVEDGVDPAEMPVDPFRVWLGAQLVEQCGEERSRVGGVEVDVTAGLGQTLSARSEGWFMIGHPEPSDPYWELPWPEKAVDEITRLLDSAGERWFGKFGTFAQAMASLEAASVLDGTLAGFAPRLIALRISGERGDRADAQRVLDQHVAGRRGDDPWPDRHLRWLARRAEMYGLHMPPAAEAKQAGP